MTEFSPVAQSVLDAAYREMDYAPRRHVCCAAAAALRAAADQVVPENHVYNETSDGTMRRVNELWIIRRGIYAIATELENCQ